MVGSGLFGLEVTYISLLLNIFVIFIKSWNWPWFTMSVPSH